MDVVTVHGLQHMASRGISKSLVESIIKNGRVLQQGTDKFLQVSKQGAVVINCAGKIITAYGSKNFDGTMKVLVKRLF